MGSVFGVKMRSIMMLIGLMSPLFAVAQSYWFGPKVGPAVNFQRWNNFERAPLLSINADFFIESYSEESTSALYASLGFRTRGSALRTVNTFDGFTSNNGFKFRNIVLELGMKKYFRPNSDLNPYYLLGVRGEYTVANNLSTYDRFATLFFPNEQFVRKFVYGVSFGAGIEKQFSEYYVGFFEFNLCPDLSNQYFQPPLPNVRDPFTNQLVNLQESVVRNVSIEFKFGMKFLRKVEYIDDY